MLKGRVSCGVLWTSRETMVYLPWLWLSRCSCFSFVFIAHHSPVLETHEYTLSFFSATTNVKNKWLGVCGRSNLPPADSGERMSIMIYLYIRDHIVSLQSLVVTWRVVWSNRIRANTFRNNTKSFFFLVIRLFMVSGLKELLDEYLKSNMNLVCCWV